MSAETALIAALVADVNVIARVPAARIASDYLEQEIGLPGIVTQRAATTYINTIHGGPPVASDATMDSYCIATTRTAAEELADLVVIALANAEFLVTDRRQEFYEDTKPVTYATVVTCMISL